MPTWEEISKHIQKFHSGKYTGQKKKVRRNEKLFDSYFNDITRIHSHESENNVATRLFVFALLPHYIIRVLLSELLIHQGEKEKKERTGEKKKKSRILNI